MMLADKGDAQAWTVVILIGIVVLFLILDRVQKRKPGFRWSSYDPLAKPGTFRVSGVEKAGGADVTISIDAASGDNAKAKAELRGIVVTKVERA